MSVSSDRISVATERLASTLMVVTTVSVSTDGPDLIVLRTSTIVPQPTAKMVLPVTIESELSTANVLPVKQACFVNWTTLASTTHANLVLSVTLRRSTERTCARARKASPEWTARKILMNVNNPVLLVNTVEYVSTLQAHSSAIVRSDLLVRGAKSISTSATRRRARTTALAWTKEADIDASACRASPANSARWKSTSVSTIPVSTAVLALT